MKRILFLFSMVFVLGSVLLPGELAYGGPAAPTPCDGQECYICVEISIDSVSHNLRDKSTTVQYDFNWEWEHEGFAASAEVFIFLYNGEQQIGNSSWPYVMQGNYEDESQTVEWEGDASACTKVWIVGVVDCTCGNDDSAEEYYPPETLAGGEPGVDTPGAESPSAEFLPTEGDSPGSGTTLTREMLCPTCGRDCTASIQISGTGYFKQKIGRDWWYKFAYTITITGHTDYSVTGQWYHKIYNVAGGETATAVTRIRGPGVYPDSTNWYIAYQIAKVTVWLKLDCTCGTSLGWTPFTYHNPG